PRARPRASAARDQPLHRAVLLPEVDHAGDARRPPVHRPHAGRPRGAHVLGPALDLARRARAQGGLVIDPWPVSRSEPLYGNRIFSVRGDWCRDPRDGKEHCFFVLESVPWVNVVARTEAGEYIMVAQWRFGVRTVSLEIPGGMVDPGESPAAAAARELLEETGYVADAIEPL